MRQENIPRTRIEPCSGENDWVQVRECFIQAFRTYPLYTYIVPDNAKREGFLRRYMDALYDVAVRNGDSVLLCVKIPTETTKGFPKKSSDREVIGGVWFVPPSEGGGWKCAKTEDFEDAYEKFKLKEYDPEAYERMEKYEKWEYENISKHICASGVPCWSGAFCAIDPEYAGRGCGNTSYQDCLRYLQQYTLKQKNSESLVCKTRRKECGTQTRTLNDNVNDGFKIKLFHAMALLNHKPRIFNFSKITQKRELETERCESSQRLPAGAMIAALSHTRRSANFHRNNGFHTMAEITYNPRDISSSECNQNDTPPFQVNVLFMDPFQTGSLGEASKLLKEPHTLTDHKQKKELCA